MSDRSTETNVEARYNLGKRYDALRRLGLRQITQYGELHEMDEAQCFIMSNDYT